MASKQKSRRTDTSIRGRIALPLFVVLLIQTVLYMAIISQGGVISHIDSNAIDIFDRQTDNLRLNIENEMIHRWSNLDRCEEEVLTGIQSVLDDNDANYEDIKTDAQLNENIIRNVSQPIIELLRRNSVTGAFIVLDGTGVRDSSLSGSRAAFYVRDNDPTTYSKGNGDLLLERGLPSISRELELSLDSFWSAVVYENDSNDYFLRPMEEASKEEFPESSNYGYWSKPFRLSENDREAVAYTIPLVSNDGMVFGALGVDLSVDYLIAQIGSAQYTQDDATFALVLSGDDNKVLDTIAQKGKLINQYFGSSGQLFIKEELESNSKIVLMDATEQNNDRLYACIKQIKLYNVNTPFVKDMWSIIGVQEESKLLQVSRQLKFLIYFLSACTFVVGTIVIATVVVSMTKPIKMLLDELDRSNPLQPVQLPRLGIKEIDKLSASIEVLSNSVAESASRFSGIIQKTNVKLGVFEYQRGGTVAYCSQKFFEILGWDNTRDGDRYVDQLEFHKRMDQMEVYQSQNDALIYHVEDKDGAERWVSITSLEDDGNRLGVVVDITDQIVEKRKIEYERDFDLLTNLHNRRAFLLELERLFKNPEQLKIAAILMWDLDNLKYINDTYGHDFGDKYIIGFANAISVAASKRCHIARRSGDEFYLFFFGYDTKEEISKEIVSVCRQVERTVFLLPNGNEYKVRASGGIAWYPQDADNIDELIRYADFAMYNVKHTSKGSVAEFDPEEWRRNSLLVNGQEAFDLLIDNSMVDYALQPIVEVSSGSVIGYEALMRPRVPQFASPDDVLRVARSQSKLFMVEKLTFFGVLDTYAKLREKGVLDEKCMIFLNSLPNQCLSDRDAEELREKYGKYLSNVVVEFTESESITSESQTKKRALVDQWGGKIAIDDYGTGYNSMSMLFRIVPDVLKVDISIIHMIDAKPGKYKLLESIITYSHQRGIKVLAEGVETTGELAACIKAGVDYLQGYYLGMPKFQIEPISEEVLQEISDARNNK